ncbi:MAG TPA: tripartite tricarboxylate transporter permease [Aurantimonas sp.]|uniref:Tripartite tricarboxylate transporter permease n=1 Tax=Aurantimonas marianensis TaxID=2920428 RepID=A0A9X2HBA3_9HYPH|nr:tripartite tricarboxylate transporter permease [Aurantimonas marianensis]MCP3055262.1 tripartite tricarboxylate transporter permease [Aurantimonas marianensis]
MDSFLTAAVIAMQPESLGAVVLGSFIGLIFGSIPGLTFTVALALALPLTFGMGSVPAIGLLLGTYIGGMTGGSVSAILLGIPGTPSAAATVIDGYPMAKTGRASIALGMAVIVSTFGGIFSLIVMVVSVNLVSRMAMSFGPAEIFALVVFGLSTICGMAGKSMLRGLIAGLLGLMAMTIGLDNMDGVPRMTFGTTTMLQGVNLLVAMIGLFAVPFIIQVFDEHRKGIAPPARMSDIRAELPSLRLIAGNFWLMIRCSSIGTVIGAIPGTGGPIASFLAYDHAKRFSKDPSRFGKGAIEGVVAPETANNAVTGGTMIPLLSLGIPGDPATAIVLAGMQIHGIVPGPALFLNHQTEVYGIYVSIVVAYVAILFMQLVGIRLFVHVLRVPPRLMAVVIVVLCGIGAFTVRNSIFDIYTMAIVGLLAYAVIKAEIPVTPIILGLVLGPTLEGEFRTAMNLSGGDLAIFYTSPTALLFFGLAAFIIALQTSGEFFARRRNKMKVGASNA